MFCRHVFGHISGGFRGISRDFAEIPEFRGSATARNIRSPVYSIKNYINHKNGNHCVNNDFANTCTFLAAQMRSITLAGKQASGALLAP